MHTARHTTTLSNDRPISYAYRRHSFAKVPALYLLGFLLAIFQSLGQHGNFFCDALATCRPTPPCWSCETKWLPNVWNQSVFKLCINGRAYQGLCRNKGVFSFKLNCCVPSWKEEWKGCAAGSSFIDPPTPDFPRNYSGECGVQISPLIIPARPSMPGSWPWQVNIEWLNNRDQYEHLCGGALINNQWIITASHCLEDLDVKNIRVILGAYDLERPSPSEITVPISKYFTHPQYVQSTHPPNDIALIKMEQKVDLTWQTEPICLPVPGQPESTDYSDCWIVGWGDTQGTGNSNVLNELKVYISDLKSCNASWRGLITNEELCVGNGYTGACKGDSGGPLVCRRNGKFDLVGVISWGNSQCTQPGFPNVYTRVYSFLNWIQNIVSVHD